ncbi:VPLPA-CTERM sorting domain-containing protein [Marimonas arenosa]|uniref:VPLPA-CTERM sorting domain-containing protein n=1 Tax=Marimonas arenosa TaxID=1795305 RepID=A0AAE3WC09_9RHOB|nr:VPLPA-CTERM sorting domain-containing protein [Marimonas arenosa]MDQ2088915.1 VPLPA-CTERM sorting domain-containing protein [Marimonas arenosa]
MKIRNLVLCAVALVVPVSASAATLQLDATIKPGITDVTDFSIVFDDNDGNGLLSIGEILSFSGVTFNFASVSFDTVTAVADVSGYTVGAFSGSWWGWSQSSGTTTGSSNPNQWSYTISAVPIPATFPLLAVGIGALGWMRRRRKAS